MRRFQVYAGLLAIALVSAFAGSAAAQEFRATVKGQVVDSSKAAVPGATVTVQNQETNEVATHDDNAEGNYTFRSCSPGSTR